MGDAGRFPKAEIYGVPPPSPYADIGPRGNDPSCEARASPTDWEAARELPDGSHRDRLF